MEALQTYFAVRDPRWHHHLGEGDDEVIIYIESDDDGQGHAMATGLHRR